MLPADQVGRLLGDHHHGGVDVAVGDEREDRGVDDAQAVDAVDPHRPRVDDGGLVDAHLRGARGVQGGLGVLADPVEDLLVGLDGGAGRELAVVERRERRLVEDVARDPDRLDPLLAVLRGREVVELHRGVLSRVGALDPHPAAGVGVHRADVDLVAVPLGRARTRRSGSRSAGSGTSGWGSRRPRCCARSRRPRSGWWRRARDGGTASRSRSWAGPASAGRGRSRPAACRRTGCRPRGGPGGSRRRRAGRGRRRCRAAARSPSGPTPESWSSCGLAIAPPQRMTSPASTRAPNAGARGSRRRPRGCPRTGRRRRSASVSTVRLGRLLTGCRYARAALSRRPRWTLRSNLAKPSCR